MNFPSGTSVPCGQSTTPDSTGAPGGQDNCNQASLVLTYTDTLDTGNCVNSALVVINRLWTLTDGCTTPVSSTQLISITDITPPIISVTPALTVDCASDYQSPPLTAAAVTLPCDLYGNTQKSLTYSDSISESQCPTIVTRTWTTTDVCGLQSSTTELIYLQDTVPPTFTQPLPPATLSLSCSDDLPTYILQGTDNCATNVTISLHNSAPISLSTDNLCPANTQIVRTWTISDNCGLTSQYQQVVTINNTPPNPCTPVNCVPSPCDTSSCPDQSCDCCRGEPLPCQPTNCQSSPCTSTACTPVPCSGCDIPYQVTTCQPKVCPPQYITIADDDGSGLGGSNRGPTADLKRKLGNTTSKANYLAISALLIFACAVSMIVVYF